MNKKQLHSEASPLRKDYLEAAFDTFDFGGSIQNGFVVRNGLFCGVGWPAIPAKCFSFKIT